MSMDTIMEESDYCVSNTDAIIYGASDISGWTQSLISDPNISNSSSTSEDEYQQQISTAAAVVGDGDNDDLMIIVSSDESSGSTNINSKQIEQKIRIFNVDLMGSRSRPHECYICGLEYPTGQALGGHMRRHRAIITSEDEYQPQISSTGDDLMIIVSSGESSRSTSNNNQIGQKVHECFICGVEFSSGQALGGHMGRHRPIIMTENVQVLPRIVKRSNVPRILCLDLNLTPLENDLNYMFG